MKEKPRGVNIFKKLSQDLKEYFIDLSMYHTKIHAYVVIEIKIGKNNQNILKES